MTTVELRGGLGNQLFQLAFAHSLQRLVGAQVAVIPRTAAPLIGVDMAILADRLGLAVVADRNVSRSATVRETPFLTASDALGRLANSGRHFIGYWQHPAYILDPHVIRPVVGGFLRECCGAGRTCDVVLHYRAYGDEPLPWRRGVPPKDYYVRALSRLGGAAEPPALVSDRPGLARRRLGSLVAGAPVTGSALEHLALLLSARRLILANSSFSWWAGFCGSAETVLYPRRYNCFHYPTPAPEFIVI